MYTIHPIPMSQDNYGWLILRAPSGGALPQAIVVDPTQAPPVRAALAHHGATLQAIWATHHHHDHIGGINALVADGHHSLAVVGGALDVAACRIPCANTALSHQDTWQGLGLTAHALHVPGHTLGATAYYVPACRAVFVGDTLFASGCGRMFEGDAAMMWTSLLRLRALPDDTLVYCGHEYTEKNLAFTGQVMPTLLGLKQARDRAQALRARHEPTVPTTLGQERAINLFLRADDGAVQQAMGARDAVQTFAALRLARDQF